MKIKRYFARDMREALAKVREEQGPDAVILSNKKIDGGIEVVAAIDYEESLLDDGPAEDRLTISHRAQKSSPAEPAPARQAEAIQNSLAQKLGTAELPDPLSPGREQAPELKAMRDEINGMRDLLENQMSSLAWGELGKRRPHRAALVRKLAELDLKPRVVRDIASNVPESLSMDDAWHKALGILSHRIQVQDDPIISDGGVIALVGPTGVGKTTSVAKLAARYALQHGADQVALVTTDTFRVGAVEQLRTYGRIMGVPVRVADNSDDLRATLAELYDRKLVLIDTAGMSQRDSILQNQLQIIQESSVLIQPYLVISAVGQRQALEESIRAFSQLDLEGCILSKLDEATGLGAILSVLVEYQLAVAYIGNGQRVPEDIQPARAYNLVSKAITMAGQSSQVAEDTELELAYGGMVADGTI